MEISALSKFVRVSPRKLQLIAKTIGKLSLEQAIAQLAYLPKSGARELLKTILSATANAKQKGLGAGKLQFQKIEILSGGGMKRFRAVSRGMAHSYKKRMSHIRVVLSSKDETEIKKSIDKKLSNQ